MKSYLLNLLTSLLELILLPLFTLIKGILMFIDIFVNSEKLTEWIGIINEIDNWLSKFDGEIKPKKGA